MNTNAHLNTPQLMFITKLSIFLIGLGFAVRANIARGLKIPFFDEINLAPSATMIAEVLGITFAGIAFSLLFGSAMADLISMKVTLLLPALAYILGSILVMVTALLPVSEMPYWLILISFLLTCLGWGTVEAATNPIVATLNPNEKKHRQNTLNVWLPAGIVVGGLAGAGFSVIGLPWEYNLVLLVVPSMMLIYLVLRAQFSVSGQQIIFRRHS